MINKLLEKIEGKWIFLLVVFFLYLITFLINFSIGQEAIFESFSLIYKMIPILFLIFVFILLSDLFIDSKKIIKIMGKDGGIRSWLIAVITGVLSHGPIYVWYPLLSDLKDKGLKNSFIAIFLCNRAIKLPLLPMMIYYFGLPFVLILTVYTVLFSIINGVIVEKIVKS